MGPIRVAMTGLPRMMSDVLGSMLERESDIQIVSRGTDGDPSALVGSTGAQVVVMGAGPELPLSAEALFMDHPEVVLLAISPDGRQASRFRLVGEQEWISEVSPHGVLHLIREVAASSLFDRWKGRSS